LQVRAAVRIPGLDQGELLQIAALAHRRCAFQQPRAGHHGQLLAKQALAAVHARAGRAVA
jgi:hypothetical protein